MNQANQKALASLERKIHKIYSDASVKVVENLNKFLKDFDRKDKKNKKKMSEDEYREWRKRQAATLNTMLKRQDHITQSLVEADRLAAEVINRNASLVYSEGFNYGTYQIESVGEVDTAFVLYDADTIERLIKDDPNLLPVNPNIPKIEQWNHSHITTAITQGIIQGESIPKIAKRLQIVVGMDERASIRNARTATTGAENAGRMASYRRAQALGIAVEKKWLATYDSRTRHSHAMIDGERVKVDGKFSNRCRYPGDPEGPPSEIYNCRCTLIPVVDGKDDDSWKDNIVIGEDEKSYAKWKAEHMAKIKGG
jgi:SPP1 gp7 family putative phage head morphogenesis protein